MRSAISTLSPVYILISFLILAPAFPMAQPYMNNPNLKNRPKEKKATYWDVKKAFEEHWDSLTYSDVEVENIRHGGWQQFKRWENFVKQRTFPSGEFPSPEILYNEYVKYKSAYANKNSSFLAANWSFIGPGVLPGNGGGSGRINCMTFDPADANTIWVGAACGGIWKTIDGGLTWTCNNDLLPSISVSDIVIDPSNTQVMYAATGDKYGIYMFYEVWGHYSAGILKSIDGGLTWNPTGMNYTLANNVLVQRLIIDPTNTQKLYAATFTGIFRTTDGGATWTNILPGYFYDIEMSPSNPGILYAGDNIGFQRSTDGGTTWNYVSGLTSGGRSSIAVTPVNGAVVYYWAESGSFASSQNSGATFTPGASPDNFCTPYGHYDMVLEVSPIDQNVVAAGGLDVALSTNGGATWATRSNWNWPAVDYVHADNKAFLFAPGSSTTLFACNDGGIFKTTNQGQTWNDLSNGIDIKQYYRFANSFQTPSLMYAGAQDNGTDKITGINNAVQVFGADGEDCLIDYTTDNVVFISYQGGNFYRSSDGGNTFAPMNVQGCDWTTPIIMDQTNNQVMYIGSDDVYKSTDNGISWLNVSSATPLDGYCLYSLEVSNSNPNYVYTASFTSAWRSTDAGTSWSSITSNLPVMYAPITCIAISGGNPDIAWATFSGFAAGEKVYMTTDGGLSWTNISGTLPNIPINCIEYQNGSNDILYIGTDLGVFYRDASMNDWVPYNTGLPNVIVNDLEVYYPTSKLRAATFGRGIWESDLQVSTLQNLDASAFSVSYPPSTTCDTIIAPVVTIRNAGFNTITAVDLYFRMDTQAYQVYNWTGSLGSLATATITLPSFTMNGGPHTFKAYTANPNSTTDQNPFNDTITRQFSIITNGIGGPPPVMQGFVISTFPPTSWTIENSSGIWARDASVGGYGLSTQSARADFYSIVAGNEDVLKSPYIDFTNVSAPIRLYFDVAYAQYAPNFIDSLIIETNSDCGNPSVKYMKWAGILATAPTTTNIFVPNPSQWRTDTINLDTLAGYGSLRFHFRANSGYGNNMYIDNINLYGSNIGIMPLSGKTETVNVYPNPAANMVNIDLNAYPGSKVGISMYDVYGKLIMNLEEKTVSEKHRTSLDVSALSEGVYFVQVRYGITVFAGRVVIIH